MTDEQRREKQRVYYYVNRDKILARQKIRYYQNRDAICKRVNERRTQRKEDGTLPVYIPSEESRQKKRVREKRRRNTMTAEQKEHEYSRQKQWRLANKEQRLAQDRARKARRSPEQVEEDRRKRRERRKQRYKTDTSFRLEVVLRSRLFQAVEDRLYKRWDSTFNLLGCSVDELIKHLESQFQPGMSWDNYGKNGWHIDHIRPCASFDLTNEEEQRRCFNYSNLQPLWAQENYRKHAKLTIGLQNDRSLATRLDDAKSNPTEHTPIPHRVQPVH